MGRKTGTITLTEDQRSYLELQTRARTIQAQTVCRARILLLRADGVSIDDIAENGLLVEDLKELPQGAAEEMKNAIKENNLDINKYAIVKMKASNSRAGGNYDYTLIPVD